MSARWPVGECCGLECTYCPQCMMAEPDGVPDPLIYEELGEIACDQCAPKVRKEWNL